MPIKQTKEPVYTASKDAKVAKNLDYNRWNSWNATEEHASAAQVTHKAARTAKITLPLGLVGLLISLVIGFGCLFIHPVLAIAVSLAGSWASHRLGQTLVNRGY